MAEQRDNEIDTLVFCKREARLLPDWCVRVALGAGSPAKNFAEGQAASEVSKFHHFILMRLCHGTPHTLHNCAIVYAFIVNLGLSTLSSGVRIYASMRASVRFSPTRLRRRICSG